MSQYLGNNLISGAEQFIGESRNVGQIIQSTVPLTDAGLHLLDGALIQGSGIYSAFVTYIAGLVDTYPDLFTTETSWQTAVTTYGVCGKFVYDSTNNTVRLPKITGIIEGTTDATALGDLVEAGLPNVEGTVYGTDFLEGPVVTGAFYNAGTVSSEAPAGGSGTSIKLGFEASRSNSIYGNSSTVQPQTIKAFYYIVIATSTKTNIEVDVDEIVTDLNGKADTDLTNVTNTAKVMMANASMPSNTKTAVTIGAAGATYTAPADGWYQCTGTAGYIYLVNESSGISFMCQLNSGIVGHCYVPVKKGDIVSLWWSGTTMSSFYFIYAVGSEA